MTAASLDISWRGVVAIIIVAACVMFLALVLLVRVQRSRRLRVGLFVEREVERDQDEPPRRD